MKQRHACQSTYCALQGTAQQTVKTLCKQLLLAGFTDAAVSTQPADTTSAKLIAVSCAPVWWSHGSWYMPGSKDHRTTCPYVLDCMELAAADCLTTPDSWHQRTTWRLPVATTT